MSESSGGEWEKMLWSFSFRSKNARLRLNIFASCPNLVIPLVCPLLVRPWVWHGNYVCSLWIKRKTKWIGTAQRTPKDRPTSPALSQNRKSGRRMTERNAHIVGTPTELGTKKESSCGKKKKSNQGNQKKTRDFLSQNAFEDNIYDYHSSLSLTIN